MWYTGHGFIGLFVFPVLAWIAIIWFTACALGSCS